MQQKEKNVFYFLLFLAMAGWGYSWVSVKILSNYMNEYEMTFFRYLFTIITLLPYLLYKKINFYISFKGLVAAIVASIIMIAYMKFFFLGTKFGTASLGGALVTTLVPINTFLIMALFFKRKTSKSDFYALSIGGIGVMTMLNIWTFNTNEIFNQANMYFLLASISWPALSIVSSRAKDTSPLVFSIYMYAFTTLGCGLFFVDITAIDYASFDMNCWFNIIGIAVISTTFATTIFFVGVEKLGVNEVSSFIFLVPFFAIFLSFIFLQETITLSIVIGTILTIYAVKKLNSKKVS